MLIYTCMSLDDLPSRQVLTGGHREVADTLDSRWSCSFAQTTLTCCFCRMVEVIEDRLVYDILRGVYCIREAQFLLKAGLYLQVSSKTVNVYFRTILMDSLIKYRLCLELNVLLLTCSKKLTLSSMVTCRYLTTLCFSIVTFVLVIISTFCISLIQQLCALKTIFVACIIPISRLLRPVAFLWRRSRSSSNLRMSYAKQARMAALFWFSSTGIFAAQMLHRSD